MTRHQSCLFKKNGFELLPLSVVETKHPVSSVQRIALVSLLDRITEFHGRLSDLKVVWLPFLFLKPSSALTPISLRRMLVMVMCFAGWLMIGLVLREVIFGDPRSLTAAKSIRLYAYAAIGFTVWFNCVTRPLWNRRARLLHN